MALQSATVSTVSIPAGSTATGTVAGVLDNGASKATHTVITTGSAGIASGAVQLQLSHDGVNWFPAGSAITLTASTVQSATVVAVAQYARAVISTVVAGGTVAASVASA